MLILMIYLAGIADNLIAFLIVIATIFLGVSFAFFWIYMDSRDDSEDTIKCIRASKRFLIFGLCTMLIATIIPNSKSIYLMSGAYVASKAIQSERVQNISNDVLTLIETKLKESTKHEN